MLSLIAKETRPAIAALVLLTLATGVLYPTVVTVAGKALFSSKADGSLVRQGDRVVGSELIAQSFTSARYFWPRPSAAGYNAASSSGSNLAPSNPALVEAVKARVADYRTSDTQNLAAVPGAMALASGSGLDPHITVEAALWQVPRVARERGIAEQNVRTMVAEHTEDRTFGVLGEVRVNVLKLNLLLDAAP